MKTFLTAFTIGIFVFLLSLTANAATEQEYLDWFNKNVALGHAYDPSAVNAYSDNAKIHLVQSSSDGIKQTMEMDGAKWKEMLLDVLDIARQAGDKSEFSDIGASVNGNQAKISANRYSVLDCFKDDNYYLIVEETGKGNFQIIEESLESSMEPRCEKISDNYVNYAVQSAAILMNKQLPVTIDPYTRLEKVSTEEKALIYQYTLENSVADKFNPEVVNQKLKPMLIQQTCMGSTRPMVNLGATVTYLYSINEDNELFSVDVKESDCL